jgi:hypothetical protein
MGGYRALDIGLDIYPAIHRVFEYSLLKVTQLCARRGIARRQSKSLFATAGTAMYDFVDEDITVRAEVVKAIWAAIATDWTNTFSRSIGYRSR